MIVKHLEEPLVLKECPRSVSSKWMRCRLLWDWSLMEKEREREAMVHNLARAASSPHHLPPLVSMVMGNRWKRIAFASSHLPVSRTGSCLSQLGMTQFPGTPNWWRAKKTQSSGELNRHSALNHKHDHSHICMFANITEGENKADVETSFSDGHFAAMTPVRPNSTCSLLLHVLFMAWPIGLWCNFLKNLLALFLPPEPSLPIS